MKKDVLEDNEGGEKRKKTDSETIEKKKKNKKKSKDLGQDGDSESHEIEQDIDNVQNGDLRANVPDKLHDTERGSILKEEVIEDREEREKRKQLEAGRKNRQKKKSKDKEQGRELENQGFEEDTGKAQIGDLKAEVFDNWHKTEKGSKLKEELIGDKETGEKKKRSETSEKSKKKNKSKDKEQGLELENHVFEEFTHDNGKAQIEDLQAKVFENWHETEKGSKLKEKLIRDKGTGEKKKRLEPSEKIKMKNKSKDKEQGLELENHGFEEDKGKAQIDDLQANVFENLHEVGKRSNLKEELIRDKETGEKKKCLEKSEKNKKENKSKCEEQGRTFDHHEIEEFKKDNHKAPIHDFPVKVSKKLQDAEKGSNLKEDGIENKEECEKRKSSETNERKKKKKDSKDKQQVRELENPESSELNKDKDKTQTEDLQVKISEKLHDEERESSVKEKMIEDKELGEKKKRSEKSEKNKKKKSKDKEQSREELGEDHMAQLGGVQIKLSGELHSTLKEKVKGEKEAGKERKSSKTKRKKKKKKKKDKRQNSEVENEEIEEELSGDVTKEEDGDEGDDEETEDGKGDTFESDSKIVFVGRNKKKGKHREVVVAKIDNSSGEETESKTSSIYPDLDRKVEARLIEHKVKMKPTIWRRVSAMWFRHSFKLMITTVFFVTTMILVIVLYGIKL